MQIENISESNRLWLIIFGLYMFLVSFATNSPLLFDLNEVVGFTKKTDLILEGSQINYLTKVSKNLKIVNDYTDDFILLCCYILRTRTEEDIQELMKQILYTFKDKTIVSKSVDLSDDICCDVLIHYSSSVNKSKQNTQNAHIIFNLFTEQSSGVNIETFFNEIREHYMGEIGNARPEFISELYTHLYNEPCLVDEYQLNRISKTPKEILECYYRYSDNSERFIRGLLRNK